MQVAERLLPAAANQKVEIKPAPPLVAVLPAAAKRQGAKSSARQWSEASGAELIRPVEEKGKEKRVLAATPRK